MNINKSLFSAETYVEVVSNRSGYEIDDLVSVCKRFNNKKRDYLFVNHLQGKHVPVKPSDALGLTEKLEDVVSEDADLKGKKLCVVGFAETATAIGRHMAKSLKGCVGVMQTTRENLKGEVELFTFDEEHSHAVSQKLYGDVKKLKDIDMFLFVEDEITTGNTILNFVDKFNKILPNKEYGVASYLNWQSKEHEERFKGRGIRTYCLVKGYIKDVNAKIDLEDRVFTPAQKSKRANVAEYVKTTLYQKVNNSSFAVDRTVTLFNDNLDALWFDAVSLGLNLADKTKKTLVLGTEEYMYTGLCVAYGLEVRGVDVKFHATTRSPIALLRDEVKADNYVIRSGVKLPSVYDCSRETYLYNIEHTYDEVIIVTDNTACSDFDIELIKALSLNGVTPKIVKVIIK